jgi:hypothetical protein
MTVANTLAQRRELALNVLRIAPESMTDDELDLAMVLLLQKPVKVDGGQAYVLEDGDWRRFSPMNDWADYGNIVSNHALVVGSHSMHDDENDSEKVTGHWYSAHSYYGSTNTEGFDLRAVVGQCCAKLLKHQVQYSDAWKPDTAAAPENSGR